MKVHGGIWLKGAEVIIDGAKVQKLIDLTQKVIFWNVGFEAEVVEQLILAFR